MKTALRVLNDLVAEKVIKDYAIGGAKVRQLVELQKRLVPIYAARGRIIVPWTDV